MTSTQLKTQIDTDITNKTTAESVTTDNVGENLKDIVDYIDQEDNLKQNKILFWASVLSQSGTSAPSGTVINTTPITFTWGYSTVGTYVLSSSVDLSTYTCILTFSNGSFASNAYTLSKNSATTFRLRTYDTGSGTPVLSNDLINGATLKIELYS